MTYEPSFLKILRGVGRTLKFFLSNMTGCNFDDTEGNDL
jgi:hypothetical protein